jgi:hypothetical protein
MFDLTRATSPCAELQQVDADPGLAWARPAAIAIDAPPDADAAPAPAASWPATAVRTGVCGTVSPRALRLADGSYRLYYSQILPRPGYPRGAADYCNATTRVLSAVSADGRCWRPEPGVRLSPQAAGAGEFRVVSAEVVPGATGGWRLYAEVCAGAQGSVNAIRSAVSDDGLAWQMLPGDCLGGDGYYSAPRIQLLPDGGQRLFACQRDVGIVSALSANGGRTFAREPGVRMAPAPGALVAFAPEIVRLPNGRWRMYFAEYANAATAAIHSALSTDGLHWQRDGVGPALAPTGAGPDAAKASEMCVVPLPADGDGQSRFAMLYEGCDGTAADARGVWRICLVRS